MTPPRDPLAALRARARALGFTAPHVADLSAFGSGPGDRLREFVAQGRHGSMAWMEATLERLYDMTPDEIGALIHHPKYAPHYNCSDRPTCPSPLCSSAPTAVCPPLHRSTIYI